MVFLLYGASHNIRAGRNGGFSALLRVRSLDVPQEYAVAHGHAKSSKNTLVTHTLLTSFVAPIFRVFASGENGLTMRFIY